MNSRRVYTLLRFLADRKLISQPWSTPFKRHLDLVGAFDEPFFHFNLDCFGLTGVGLDQALVSTLTQNRQRFRIEDSSVIYLRLLASNPSIRSRLLYKARLFLILIF